LDQCSNSFKAILLVHQALRDGDKIWGTLVTGTNQDGGTVKPITAPSGEQQKQLMRDIYEKHHVDVAHIDYFEAHGEN
jgi:acyl transferase domain-containing protein